ncbi:thermonuclease family protein [Pseudodesulfovibrio piezophilus]|uniref:Nuclease (SNase domain protein) (Modular protein) n=1 Tax=Pseudodesulfovibrio piezophilus (strain DSM 21447 / JCM 15486 / C1TLV30) TaxID=1322246 RepID=M1WRK1_PSEP2|nr:thermonuclease family protein [Pseudodesulfovibrio piezophilus]CCH49604.1 Nuclease (SNase domain protein) (modular protein) [Pseudodesulfovibrio piezophilus C1TLV30]
MRLHNKLFLFFLILFFLGTSATAQADETVPFLHLIDGDSILVEYEGHSQAVRLIGVDAPEWGQEYGTQAKSFALKFCYGKNLRLEFDRTRRDRHGRLLAYVYSGTSMLNEELVRAGLALAERYEPNTRHQPRLEQAQDEAKRKRMGFWLRGGLEQTPAQWRKTHPRKGGNSPLRQ